LDAIYIIFMNQKRIFSLLIAFNKVKVSIANDNVFIVFKSFL
jgi:hypothetical protein